MPSRPSVLLLAALAIALASAGCGRKGALEPPGTVEQPLATPTVFGASPPPPAVPPPAPPADDEFFLDAII